MKAWKIYTVNIQLTSKTRFHQIEINMADKNRFLNYNQNADQKK